jgi:phosphinothricin acetyltransferase
VSITNKQRTVEGKQVESTERETTIRPATTDDVPEIATIWSEGQVSQGERPLTPEEAMGVFCERLQAPIPPYGIWVAEVEGMVVGWQSLHRTRANPALSGWAESSTYISQRYKGRGVGRKLLTFATQYANASKFMYVEGFIKADNQAPARIVESLGWQKIGRLPRRNPREVEWLYYVYAVPHEL